MRMAICLNNKGISDHLRLLFNHYEVQNKVVLDCRFLGGDTELLADLTGGEYDAIFLELFPNISNVIEEIRQKDKLVRLIPVAEVSAWVAEDYGKDIWYGLPAPVSEAFLFAVLDRLILDLKQSTDTGIIIKSRKGVVRLAFSDLEYVEVISKTVCFHLLGGKTEEVSGALSDYEAQLLYWPDFIKVHRSYIVNQRFIQKLRQKNILTRSGHSVPVSRHLFQQFKKDYLCQMMDPDLDPLSLVEADPAPVVAPPKPSGKYAILLVDDEADQLLRWAKALEGNGVRVETADCGEVALSLGGEMHFDAVVLDVKLGSQSGFDLCAALGERTGAPVIFLSSLTDSESQTQGFLSGGIDYITKDTTNELFWLKVDTRIKMARVNKAELTQRNLRLDLKKRKAFVQDQEVALTTVEFDLLCLLMQNPGTIYTPGRLYSLVWGGQQWDDGQTVQLHLSQLRRKLEGIYPQHSFIETVWGKGYCFVMEE